MTGGAIHAVVFVESILLLQTCLSMDEYMVYYTYMKARTESRSKRGIELLCICNNYMCPSVRLSSLLPPGTMVLNGVTALVDSTP